MATSRSRNSFCRPSRVSSSHGIRFLSGPISYDIYLSEPTQIYRYLRNRHETNVSSQGPKTWPRNIGIPENLYQPMVNLYVLHNNMRKWLKTSLNIQNQSRFCKIKAFYNPIFIATIKVTKTEALFPSKNYESSNYTLYTRILKVNRKLTNNQSQNLRNCTSTYRKLSISLNQQLPELLEISVTTPIPFQTPYTSYSQSLPNAAHLPEPHAQLHEGTHVAKQQEAGQLPG